MLARRPPRHGRVLVPASFRALLDATGGRATRTPCWQFFLGRAASSDPASVREALRALDATPYAVPHAATGLVRRLDLIAALPTKYETDEPLAGVLREELAFLTTRSPVLSRVKKPFDALVRGGCVAVTGLGEVVPEDLAGRLRATGWRRVCRYAAVGLPIAWASREPAGDPHGLRDDLESALVRFAILDA